MKSETLIQEISKKVDPHLAADLVNQFLELRRDCQSRTLGRSSGGKFIETSVQVLQFLESGKYDIKPDVDGYLRSLESRSCSLTDDLRVCMSRIARSAYTLRNKRNILHKGQVDPNIYDLRYMYHAAQWILSEVVRYSGVGDMGTAGKMIEFIQMPLSEFVEDFGDRLLVHGNVTVAEEILVLLHSRYPEFVLVTYIRNSLERRSKSAVFNAIRELWEMKLIHKTEQGVKLTQPGVTAGGLILAKL